MKTRERNLLIDMAGLSRWDNFAFTRVISYLNATD